MMPFLKISHSSGRGAVRLKFLIKQECIPVGCVLSATVAVCRGGLLPGAVCLLPGGVPPPRGGLCLLPEGGAYSQGGVPALGGGCLLPRGGGIPACTEADPPCGQTHRCKNITFATSLRTVIIKGNLILKKVIEKIVQFYFCHRLPPAAQ